MQVFHIYPKLVYSCEEWNELPVFGNLFSSAENPTRCTMHSISSMKNEKSIIKCTDERRTSLITSSTDLFIQLKLNSKSTVWLVGII
jgi:hypothetical protein